MTRIYTHTHTANGVKLRFINDNRVLHDKVRMMPVCTSDLGGTTPSDDGIEDDDGDDDTNSVIKTMNERVARYLQTYSLKRLLSVATEMHDEVRQTEEAIQTLVYENYTQFVSIIPAIRSTDFLQEDEVHARSAALVSDLRAFGKQRDGVLQHLWPVVKNSRVSSNHLAKAAALSL